MFSYSTADPAVQLTDSAPEDSDESSESDSEYDMGEVQDILEEANYDVKPGLGDKSYIPYQQYDRKDVSRHIINNGKSRYLFLKNRDTGASFVVFYTGKQGIKGQTPGDLFKPNTIKRCSLTPLETRAFEKTFQTQPDGIVSLRNSTERMLWLERLSTYFMLVQSNMFSNVDVVDTDDKQTLLYNFVVSRSPLDRMSIARKFKKDMDMPLLDVGTIAQPPVRKKRKLSTDDLLEATKQLGNKIVTLKPLPAPKQEAPFGAAQGVAAARKLGFDFVTLTPATEQQEAPTPAAPAEQTELPFNAAQGVAASRELGFNFVTLAAAQAPVQAPVQAPAEQTEPQFTVGQGLEAANELGFKIVTLKKQ